MNNFFLTCTSGCDTTSAAAEKGKLSFYNTWSQLPKITPTFERLGNIVDVDLVTEDNFPQIKNFFVILYSPRFSTNYNINIARRILFAQWGRLFENLSATFNCLQKHTLWSYHQTTKWSNALLKQRLNLDPVNWLGRNLEEVLYLCEMTSPTNMKHIVN